LKVNAMPRTDTKPIIIGVTGGIGCGKSYICRIIGSLGFPVYNCDAEAKKLMNTNKHIINSLKQLIGENSYDSEGNLNKPIIAQFLFANEENAHKINSVVHPVVKEDFRSWASAQNADLIFMESAILFESGFNDVVDNVITITAPPETRIERTIRRDNTTREQVIARMNQQMQDEERVRLSDYIICNNTNDNVEQQIKTIIETLSKQVH